MPSGVPPVVSAAVVPAPPASFVVAAAAGGHHAQDAGRQQRRRPASDSLLAHASSPPFDLVSIVNAFSGSQLARIRVPCRSNTSLEPRSRFWLTADQLAACVELRRGSA